MTAALIDSDAILRLLKERLPQSIFKQSAKKLVRTITGAPQLFSMEILESATDPDLISAAMHADDLGAVLWLLSREKPRGLLTQDKRLTFLPVGDMFDKDVKKAKMQHLAHLRSLSDVDEWSPNMHALEGRYLLEAELLAKLVLRERGLPFGFFADKLVESAGAPPSWRSAALAYRPALANDAAARLALDVIDGISDLRTIVTSPYRDEADITMEAMRLGSWIERLYQNRQHGTQVDRRRRSDDALKRVNSSRAVSDGVRVKIAATYKRLKKTIRGNEGTYRAVVEELAIPWLTTGAVRNVVNPGNRKKKK